MSSRFVLILFVVMLASACQAPVSNVTPTTTAAPAVTEIPPTIIPTPTTVTFPLVGPQAGTTMLWLDGSTLVYVPAGEFIMGDGAADAPMHRVRLNAYWIQQSEVTNAMYAACVRAGSCKGVPSLTETGGEARPVTGVNWIQARNYCDWIQGRLPTEAEWERAAQGAGGTAYPWGDEAPDCKRVNFGNCRRAAVTIGSTQQGNSPFGLFDMAGNVAEWVGDWYAPDYYQTAPPDNPIGPPYGNVRVVRGGSYLSSAAQISAYTRSYEWPKNNRPDLGFRCVVPNPILYPPYCQTTAFVPESTSSDSESACQPPSVTVRGSYCQQKKGYVSADIPAGARWRVETARFDCTITPISAQIDRLTCFGQGNVDFQVTICSAGCFTQAFAAQPVCLPGYAFETDKRACIYHLSPLATCPDGFVRLEKDSEEVCVPEAIEQVCPTGQYFDEGVGACLPASGQLDCLIYGLEATQAAEACYQGCPAGYIYNTSAQCCQSKSAGYAGCMPGYVYDTARNACVSGAGFSSEGCLTMTLRTGTCVDCGIYPNCEPGCKADKNTQTCVMR